MEGHRPVANEDATQFEQRKQDHIKFSLDPEVQTRQLLGLDQLRLIHQALPELDFEEIQIKDSQSALFSSIFFVASMTAGHKDGDAINRTLAEACAEMSWPFAVGSQRRELYDKTDGRIWPELHKKHSDLFLIGNIGLSQAIVSRVEDIKAFTENMQAKALMIHTNPLQEAIQQEGTPQFKSGLKTIETICKSLSIPVVLKETGCGFSRQTLKQINSVGLHAVDLSGLGGTHWGRIEGMRATNFKASVAETFKDWGNSTLDSLLNAFEQKLNYQIWASGGIRNGLDAAKCLALGARKVSIAKPILEKALISTDAVIEFMKQTEYELQVAMFCTGSKQISDLQKITHIQYHQQLLERNHV
jgi:isopentenyl-diphosphate delta-isomerase